MDNDAVNLVPPAPVPGDPGSPAPSRGGGQEARWGPLPPCPCSCFSPAPGHPAGPIFPRTVSEGGGGARGGDQCPEVGVQIGSRAQGACWLCLEARVQVASLLEYPCVCLRASLSLRTVGCAGVCTLLCTRPTVCVSVCAAGVWISGGCCLF